MNITSVNGISMAKFSYLVTAKSPRKPAMGRLAFALASMMAASYASCAFAITQRSIPNCSSINNKANPRKARAHTIKKVLVLPDAITPQQVAPGLGDHDKLCLASPNTLTAALARLQPEAVVYLRKEQLSADQYNMWPKATWLITYRPSAHVKTQIRQKVLGVDSAAQLRLYSRYLSGSTRPVVVIADRKIPRLASLRGKAEPKYLSWQQVPANLKALCSAKSHILVLVSPSKAQQLGHRLADAERCGSNWYFTSSHRTQKTLKPLMKAIKTKKLRAYLLDSIGYYRKDPSLIAAFGYDSLAEVPTPQQSLAIRSLYYVYAALKEQGEREGFALRKGRELVERRFAHTKAKTKAKAYVFRIAATGIVLDRKIR